MRGPIATLIGQRVYAKRTERALSQSDLAKAVGISRQAIWFIEHGKQTPSWTTLYAVAGVLRCVPADLIPSIGQVRRFKP